VSAAVNLASGALMHGDVPLGEAIAFWILGPVSLAGAIGMVMFRNAIHSALSLVATMMCLGAFYVIEQGPFLGLVQIIVYTGAIMILFLFVLMLVGRDSSDSIVETLRGQRLAAVLLGIGLAALVTTGLYRALGDVSARGLEQTNEAGGGNVDSIAALLFTRYVFAFEVTSALLITAAVGAMILAHVERDKGGVPTQRERSIARFRKGNYPAPKPGPGVYALSDSVATPGLLPDGTPAEGSVAPSVERRELDSGLTTPKG
jgi:NADH-quinone oxidoreductase subunit J